MPQRHILVEPLQVAGLTNGKFSPDDGRPAATAAEVDGKTVAGSDRLADMLIVGGFFRGVDSVGEDVGLVLSSAEE